MNYQLAYHSLAGGRASNQDRIVCVERDNAVLMVLADGLGGHEGGALAAEILTRTAQHAFESVRQPLITKPSAFLTLTIAQAHKAIVARGAAMNPPLTPRTTCVLCLVQNGYAYWAHVGDSRLYHFRAGRVLSRTLDHTVTEQMHLDGVISEEEMQRHPEKSRLLKALGGSHPPSISLGEETVLMPGDTLLLCTDGLWEALSAEELAAQLRRPSLEEAIEEMLFNAELRMRQNADNLSAIGLRWEDAPTTALPLQSGPAADANPQSLLTDTEALLAGRRRKAETTAPDPKKSLEAAIDELEAFLAKFEKQ